MIRLVIDTNVVVSGMLSPAGNEAMVLLAVAAGLVRPCYTTDILREYEGVLSRPKFGFEPDVIRGLLDTFAINGEHVFPREFPDVSPDPGDTMFLHCALTAGADYLVTGNRRHFPAGLYGTTKVVSAGMLAGLIIPRT